MLTIHETREAALLIEDALRLLLAAERRMIQGQQDAITLSMMRSARDSLHRVARPLTRSVLDLEEPPRV